MWMTNSNTLVIRTLSFTFQLPLQQEFEMVSKADDGTAQFDPVSFQATKRIPHVGMAL